MVLGIALLLAAVLVKPGRPSPREQAHAGQEEGRQPRSDQPDEALRFRRLQMQDEKKSIPIDGLLKAKRQVELMRAAQARRAQAAGKSLETMEVAAIQPGDWAWLGPGNVGGRIRSIVIDPNNPNSIWVGSVGGGIWHSTDAGASWQPVNDFLANLAVATMAINPANTSVMYAGTGEGFGNIDALQGGGIFKSSDGGTTWNLLATTNPAITPAPPGCGVGAAPCPNFWTQVNRIAISPNGNTILAATNGGIARSTDAGATWSQQTNTAALDIDFRPNDSTQAVAGELAFARFSTDGGQTWSGANFNPAISNGGTAATNGRTELAYAGNATPQIVYAAVNNNNGDLYRSIDGGQNFSRVNTGTNFFISGAGNQGWYDNALWVNPQDPTFVIVGGIDLFRSTDSGSTFTQISRWQCGPGQNGVGCPERSAHGDQHAIVAHPGFNNATNKTVYFGNDGGLFRANDVSTVSQTSGWTNLNNNLGITQFHGGVASASGVLFGGAQDNGTLRADIQTSFNPPYDPQGWATPVNGGGDGGYVAADPLDGNYLYGEQQNLQLFRSSDGGGSVNVINAGISDAASANFIAPFVLDPGNPNTMLAGALSLWRSNDVKTAAAPTWTAIKNPNPTIPAPSPSPTPTPAPNPISAIVVSPTNSDFIVVGHNDGQIFMTLNGTASSPGWSAINKPTTPARLVTRLTIDNTRNPNWIYATFGGFSNNNVYVTKNLGATWADVSGATGTSTDLPAVPVRSIVFNPANRNFLYVGTEVGIFASEDAGTTWQLPQGGPANVSVDELFFQDGKLVAATHGRGMFTTHVPLFTSPACGTTGQCGPPDCTGYWDCPCTWGNNQVPGANDDVVINCPVTIRAGPSVYCRNLTVNGRLTIESGIEVVTSGDIINYGTIDGSSGGLRANNVANVRAPNAIGDRGVITIGRILAQGDIVDYGIIAASGERNANGDNPIQCNTLSLGNNGTLSANEVFCRNDLLLGANTVLSALSTNPNVAALTVLGNIHNDGSINSPGRLYIPAGANIRSFSGTGLWQLGSFTMGDPANPNGNGATVVLENDLTIYAGNQTFFGNDSIFVSTNSTLLQNDHNLTLNSTSVFSLGLLDLGSGGLVLSGNYFRFYNNGARFSGLGLPGFRGDGLIDLTTTGAAPYLGITAPVEPRFRMTAGTVNAEITANFARSIQILTGATFNFNFGSISLNGDLSVSGTFAKTSPSSTSTTLKFNGATLTNNGSLSTDSLIFNFGTGLSFSQSIGGTGTWPVGTWLQIGSPGNASTTTLTDDVVLNYSYFGIATGSSVNTNAYTLTMPCSTAWSTVYGTGEVIGNVRRTNLSACTGAIAFGSPFSTIQFTVGTPPNDVTMSMLPAAPAGFGSAVQRDYSITPTGGSGYSATLRLHYLDSELNGNDESILALWRKDGSNWSAQGATTRDPVNNWVQYAGVTQFSPWALASCLTSIFPTSASAPSGGGTGNFQVTSTGGCAWTAGSNAPWLVVTSGASGAGNGTVNYMVDANTGAGRSGTITVSGIALNSVFTVTQAPDCSSLSINPTSQNFTPQDAYGSVSVSAANFCAWQATSNDSWIYVTSGASGTGNGTVNYYVYLNDGPARAGTMTIGGQTFAVTQDSGCSSNFYISPTEGEMASDGGSGTISVNATAGCDWTSTSNDGWITITSGAAGSGNGMVDYSVAQNTGPPRVGTFIIGGQTFTVHQGSNAPVSPTVTNTSDSGPGSLRQAILDANANFGQVNTIQFNITGDLTITPATPFPEITNPVVINGMNSNGQRVVLSGAAYASYGLVFRAPGCEVRGLIIDQFYIGIFLYAGADNTVIENCYFGTDATATANLANSNAGIAICSNNNRIGGSAAATANMVVFSGNTGIALWCGTGNVVQGNYIGTNPAGADMGNGYSGIQLYSSGNIIGGIASGAGNTIAFNHGPGVVVYYSGGEAIHGNSSEAGNAIRGNSIFSNDGLGIDLDGDGVTLNDDGDGDSGANNGQNFPVITSAHQGSTAIQGSLNSTPNTVVDLDFYASPLPDPTGYGEGKTFLGSSTVTTGTDGNAPFNVTLPTTTPQGDVVTATATDPAGNTSEFSQNMTVAPPAVQLTGVVSSKLHGSLGPFGINLPLTGNPGIECRSGGAGGVYTLLFTFANTLTNVAGAGVSTGTGSVSSSYIDTSDAHIYVVNLTGVANMQVLTVSLTDVTDSSGSSSSVLTASMGVLLGDTTANGTVNSSDIGEAKGNSGQVTNAGNFRTDVTINGVINSSDIGTIKAQSGTALP